MAKVSAHGREIGTVYFTTKAKRYMSDGAILVNHGEGWKLYGKVKDASTPERAYASQVAKSEAFARERPALAAYRRLLHDMAGMCNRWKLHAAILAMPDDADGVWSEACDGYSGNVSANVDEVSALCRAYKVALLESDDIRAESKVEKVS